MRPTLKMLEMRMRGSLSIIIITLAALALAGCGSAEDSGGQDKGQPPAEAAGAPAGAGETEMAAVPDTDAYPSAIQVSDARGTLTTDKGSYTEGEQVAVSWSGFPPRREIIVSLGKLGHGPNVSNTWSTQGMPAGQTHFHSQFHEGGSQIRAWLETVDGAVLYANGPMIKVTQAP